MVIIVSSSFRKSVKHLDKKQRETLQKAIKKIIAKPDSGIPLRYGRSERALRMKPFRIVYAQKKDTLFLLKFEHRKEMYST